MIPIDTGYRLLADAIILQAVESYRRAVRRLRKHSNNLEALRTKRTIEDFFLSDWFNTLCDLDGKQLILDLKQQVVEVS